VKLNADSEGKTNGIPDDPEHHRSVATLATRLCGKVFGFVKENLSGAQRRKSAASGERGAGKGAAALVPASALKKPMGGLQVVTAEGVRNVPLQNSIVSPPRLVQAQHRQHKRLFRGVRLFPSAGG